jgi:hypothetical protein
MTIYKMTLYKMTLYKKNYFDPSTTRVLVLHSNIRKTNKSGRLLPLGSKFPLLHNCQILPIHKNVSS